MDRSTLPDVVIPDLLIQYEIGYNLTNLSRRQGDWFHGPLGGMLHDEQNIARCDAEAEKYRPEPIPPVIEECEVTERCMVEWQDKSRQDQALMKITRCTLSDHVMDTVWRLEDSIWIKAGDVPRSVTDELVRLKANEKDNY